MLGSALGALVAFGSMSAFEASPTALAVGAGAYSALLIAILAFTLGDQSATLQQGWWLPLAIVYASIFVALSWQIRQFGSDVTLLVTSAASLVFLVLLAARVLVRLLDHFVVLPLLNRQVVVLSPSQTATVYLYNFLVELDQNSRSWRKAGHRRNLARSIQATVDALRRDVPRAARNGGASYGGVSDTAIRQRVADLTAVLANVEVDLLHVTNAAQFAAIQRLTTRITLVLAEGNWVAPQAGQQPLPAASRTRRIWAAIPRIAVPLGLAVSLPFLPLNIPADNLQVAQVVFVLTALLSVPGIDASVRGDALTAVRQASARN